MFVHIYDFGSPLLKMQKLAALSGARSGTSFAEGERSTEIA